MSNDKKGHAITFDRYGVVSTMMVRRNAPNGGETLAPADGADLLCFDLVPASQLAEVTEKLEAAEGRNAAMSRIIRRALGCGQLEKLEDARVYLDGATEGAKPAEPAERCRGESLKGRCVLAAEPTSPPSPAQAEQWPIVGSVTTAYPLLPEHEVALGEKPGDLAYMVDQLLPYAQSENEEDLTPREIVDRCRLVLSTFDPARQPPAGHGTTLTVEMMVEALRRFSGSDALEDFTGWLANELKRAQKGWK